MGTDDEPPHAPEASRDGPVSTTREYEGVDARALTASAERAIADVVDGDVRVEVAVDGDHESTDDKRATERRIAAVSRGVAIDAGAIAYRPYGPHSAMLIVLGFIFMLPTIFLSLFVSALALYFYYRERPMDLPLEARDVVRVVAEETADGRGVDGEPTDSRTSTVTLTYTAETYLSVDADRIPDLAWPRRLAVMNYVHYWHNLIADQAVERDNDDTVMGHLTAWADRDPDSHADTVRSFQDTLGRDPEHRREYTDLLVDQLPGVEDELERHRESVRADLETLADEVAVAVEHERA